MYFPGGLENTPLNHLTNFLYCSSIRLALDSQDSVELRAAIYAAARFAARSTSFAVNMCEKISDMIKGYATTPEMKLRLIPMFQHMHHDARTAQIVRQTCIEMLPGI